MSMFNKFAVMIAFAVCTTNAWADGVMKNDPNAIGILDCVGGNGEFGVSWGGENFDCSAKNHGGWSHNFHSTKAICKKFVADAYYNKYKNDTGMTGGEYWPDSVTELPALIDGKYMLRCVATECEDGYELARDKNGNSMGWCRRRSVVNKSGDDKKQSKNGCVLTLKSGQKVNLEDDIVEFEYVDDTGKTKSSDDYDFEFRSVSKINDQDVSSFFSGAKTGGIACWRGEQPEWYIYECDTKNGYIAEEQINVAYGISKWFVLNKPECVGHYLMDGMNQCNDIPLYKKCVKKSSNGESESGTTSTTVFDDLDKFISEKFVGSSVWKNDEGNFNTARLVSDSVAGVVLGTAGGVITSHIIKKNQIENGFDDLKCTIGGQTVASYGDEFRVGVK